MAMCTQTRPFILASSSPQRRLLLEQMGIDVQILPVQLVEDHSLGQNAAALVEILALQKLGRRLQEKHPALLPQAFIMAADTIVAVDKQRLGKPESHEQARNFLKTLSGRSHEVCTALALYIPTSCIVAVARESATTRKFGDAVVHRIATGSTGDDIGSNASVGASAGDNIEIAEEPPDHLSLPCPVPPPFQSQGIIISAIATTRVHFISLTEEEIDYCLSWNEYQGAAGGYRIQGRSGCFLQKIQGSYSNVLGLPTALLYDILRGTSFFRW